MKLDEKVALVTGSSDRIGAGIEVKANGSQPITTEGFYDNDHSYTIGM